MNLDKFDWIVLIESDSCFKERLDICVKVWRESWVFFSEMLFFWGRIFFNNGLYS